MEFNVLDLSSNYKAGDKIQRQDGTMVEVTELEARPKSINAEGLFPLDNLDKEYQVRGTENYLRAIEISGHVFIYLSKEKRDIELVDEWVKKLNIQPIS